MPAGSRRPTAAPTAGKRGSKLQIIHAHLHARRTGVTRHVEDMVRALPALAFGDSLDVPTIRFGELVKIVRAQPAVFHAHRNHELLLGLGLRRLARDLRVIFTRHSERSPSAYT